MKWEWKNCPVAWRGQYQGKEKTPTVTLEAIATRNPRIRHFCFGHPGSANDISVLQNPTLIPVLSRGEFPPPTEFKVAGTVLKKPYFLADGIYPRRPIFVLPIHEPTSEKERNFTKLQESFRKDVERAFGVLQIK